jgi:basic membrane protein A
MIDLRMLSRRGFLNMSAAGAAAAMLPTGFARQALAATPLPAIKEEDAVVGFGHVGPISDEGWTWAHHQGLLAVKEAYPKLKKILEVENIPYSADATRTYRQFVSEGANIIFDTSSKGDFLHEVVKRAPDVAFLECDGQVTMDNLGWYYLAHWYPTYVIGVAAGHLSKSGKLGYVASFPVSSVFASTNAFLMGARTVNPNATLQTIVINSWFDPQAATQAGTALIDNGCDFLFGIMDEAGYLQVAEKRGVWAAMWNTDIRRYGPNSYVSSVMIDFNKFYVDQVGKRLAGTWTPGRSRQGGRCRARQDPGRLVAFRRRVEGLDRCGACRGRPEDDRARTLHMGLVGRRRYRPHHLITIGLPSQGPDRQYGRPGSPLSNSGCPS